jgi:uncharacterized membrane protein (DUF4010 family)
MMSLDTFLNLGVALAVGLLIGTERGWEQREQQDGSRVAGIRTFGLTGLVGGMVALLGHEVGPLFMMTGLASYALVLAAVVLRDTPTHTSRGATTILALFATFVVGAIAGWGDAPVVSITVAAVITLMLGMKRSMHDWLTTIDSDEMNAAFKLLLVSAVVLPLLPNKDYGPWGALNPYHIWWMVVVISFISFVGFFAIRSTSARRGILLTAVFGGLASSTAIAVSFSKLGHDNPNLQKMLASGVIISSVLMSLRMVVVASIGSLTLALYLIPAMLLMVLGGVGAAWFIWRNSDDEHLTPVAPAGEGFSLSIPIRFGIVFAVILLAVAAVRQWQGDQGLYGVAILAGLTDVDAITLSLAHNIGKGLAVDIAGRAAIMASLANTVVKFSIVAVMCGGVMAHRAAIGYGAIFIGGVIGIIFGNLGITINPSIIGL